MDNNNALPDKPLVFTLLAINVGVAILNFFGVIPDYIRESLVFKIAAGAIFLTCAIPLFRLLHKYLKTKHWSQKVSTYVIVLFISYIIIAITFHKTPESPLKELSETPGTVNDYSGATIEKNTNVTYKMNKPPQRKLTQQDKKLILTSITTENDRIKINYPEKDKEAKTFADEIFDFLIESGYTSLSLVMLDNFPTDTKNKRISVKNDFTSETILNFIVNPQE